MRSNLGSCRTTALSLGGFVPCALNFAKNLSTRFSLSTHSRVSPFCFCKSFLRRYCCGRRDTQVIAAVVLCAPNRDLDNAIKRKKRRFFMMIVAASRFFLFCFFAVVNSGELSWKLTRFVVVPLCPTDVVTSSGGIATSVLSAMISAIHGSARS